MKQKIWSCKIGECSPDHLPDGADAPMRSAISTAYSKLTGQPADFIFSGWGAELTEGERAVHEDREPVRVRPTPPCAGILDRYGNYAHCSDCKAYARLVARVEALTTKIENWMETAEANDERDVYCAFETVRWELRALLPDVSKGTP